MADRDSVAAHHLFATEVLFKERPDHSLRRFGNPRTRTGTAATSRARALCRARLVHASACAATQLGTSCAVTVQSVGRSRARKSPPDEGAESGSVDAGSGARSSCAGPRGGEAVQATAPAPRHVVRWRPSKFNLSPEFRKVIYTTNAITSHIMVMRNYTRNRRAFRNDDSALESTFLAIREASTNGKSIHHWKPALQRFQVRFRAARVPLAAL